MGLRIDMLEGRVNARQISKVSDIIREGGVAVLPTDSSYALVCRVGNAQGIEKIRMIRQLDEKHHFTLLCANLSELASYAEVNNEVFRFIKSHIPGPYTFILKATKAVPKRLQQAKRKTIGLRVPQHGILQAILNELNEGILGVSLSSSQHSCDDYYELIENIKDKVDVIVDSGALNEQTTVLDYSGSYPETIREGAGAIDWE